MDLRKMVGNSISVLCKYYNNNKYNIEEQAVTKGRNIALINL